MKEFFSQNADKIILIAALVLVVSAVLALAYFLRKKGLLRWRDKFEELHLKIQEDLKFAVAPQFMTLSVEVGEITNLAIEIWRIEQRIAKSAASLPESQLKGLENSVQKLRRYLEKYDVQIVDYKNTKYNAGLNLDILSVEKDPTIQESIVKETIEPTIMCKGQMVRKAKIILLSNH